MPRILGVDVPSDKVVQVALTYIYGIGRTSAAAICKEAGVKPSTRAKDLTGDELARITAILDKKYVIEGQLRRQVMQNIARLKKIGCYRGIRHGRGMPVRGQRTRTNARTRKGKRRTVAGKKSVKAVR